AACDADEECIPADGGSTGCYRGETWTSCGGVCSNGQSVGSACDNFFPGAQCLSGWCRIDAGYEGMCEPFTALGDACSGPTCDPDSFCDVSHSPSVCAARGGSGSACSGDTCQLGLHCGNGTCKSAANDGGTCDASDLHSCAYPLGCYGGICRPGQYMIGDACPAGSVECLDSTCTPVSDGGSVCLPEPGLGEACTQFCANPYQCNAGTCVALAALGEPCAQGCRTGLHCASGTCAAN